MNQQQKIDKMAAALRDCVKLFSGELDGLKVIQPELRQAEQALDCLDLVDAEMPFDWSKAPAGTTHRRIDDFRFPWRMLSNGLWHSWSDGWMVVTSGDPDLYVARPSLEWRGKGLPPVGTVCEHEGVIGGSRQDWVLAKILAHTVVNGQKVAVHQIGEQISFSSARHYRPIRTPEQMAAEERKSEIEAMAKVLGVVACDDYVAATALYDAGYRKQVAE